MALIASETYHHAGAEWSSKGVKVLGDVLIGPVGRHGARPMAPIVKIGAIGLAYFKTKFYCGGGGVIQWGPSRLNMHIPWWLTFASRVSINIAGRVDAHAHATVHRCSLHCYAMAHATCCVQVRHLFVHAQKQRARSLFALRPHVLRTGSLTCAPRAA
eukprot:scaffold5962_cov103-Isochrysis_galbana.AAC.7